MNADDVQTNKPHRLRSSEMIGGKAEKIANRTTVL